jgi:hypothetical protein
MVEKTGHGDEITASGGGTHKFLPPWLNSHRLEIDKAIALVLNSQRPEIKSLAEDAVFRGRKLRGTLALQMIEWCGWKLTDADRVNLLADLARMEILHAMSCVLDDVIDQDDFRRGEPAYHIRQGKATAILLPLLFVNEFAANAELRAKVTQVITGELFDCKLIAKHGHEHFSDPLNEYLLKAVPLFAYAHLMAAKHAKRSAVEVAAAERYGAAMGRYYQVANDHHDFFSLPPDVRGDQQEKILMNFSVPFYFYFKKFPGNDSYLGKEILRRDLAKIIEQCRGEGIEVESAVFLKRLRFVVETNFPGERIPKELYSLLEKINTPQFWGYEYGEKASKKI